MFWKTWVNLQGTVKKCHTPRNLRLALDLFILGGTYIVVLLHSEHVTTSVRKNSVSLSRKLEEAHNQEKYSVCFASAWCQCHHLFIVNKYYVGIIEKQGAAEGHSYIGVGAMKKMAPRTTPANLNHVMPCGQDTLGSTSLPYALEQSISGNFSFWSVTQIVKWFLSQPTFAGTSQSVGTSCGCWPYPSFLPFLFLLTTSPV